MANLRVFNRIISSIHKLPNITASIKVNRYNLRSSFNRFKYTQNTGVKGLKNRKSQFIELNAKKLEDENEILEDFMLDDTEYDIVANTAMNVTRDVKTEQVVFVIQPYIKWGAKTTTPPNLQLQEAEALIRSIPQWKIELSMKIPLESLEKRTLFGKGKLKEINNLLNTLRSKGKRITCIFISKGTLSFNQKRFLEDEFGTIIMDRYSVVVQILRLHATTAEAKIQVAMAEIPYIWGHMKDTNVSTSRKQGYYLNDTQKEMLKRRERKLKQVLQNIRGHRKLLRNKRKQKNYPIVAVVGYTNAGKTSLIKALTDEQALQPKDQLFATLDVTAHAGLLPCNLEVIYMDTVGFMSDIPTGLIECFISTLEDAMLADIIIHVQDLSHENYIEQKRHVENTLKSLANTIQTENENITIPPIIDVGNKVDLVNLNDSYSDMKLVSSKTLAGINDLMLDIESKILKVTNRSKIIFKVNNGGEEMSWLYKNSAVTTVAADPDNEQSILIEAVITNSKLQQFKHYFIKK